ncbi:hypothetical protein MY10362_009387, partial [Beauveria mimosiformis]
MRHSSVGGGAALSVGSVPQYRFLAASRNLPALLLRMHECHFQGLLQRLLGWPFFLLDGNTSLWLLWCVSSSAWGRRKCFQVSGVRNLRFFGVFGCDSYVDGDDTEDVTTEVCVYGCPTADMLDSGD